MHYYNLTNTDYPNITFSYWDLLPRVGACEVNDIYDTPLSKGQVRLH
jgi:hypothetical protein